MKRQQFNLDRFVLAQNKYLSVVLKELKSKRKNTHWIWFIFPQLKGLGKSYASDYYGISGKEETIEYYKNAFLKRNLLTCTDIISKYTKDEFINAFLEVDVKKVKSCMTLFFLTTREKKFKIILDKFFDGELDKNTALLLRGE